MSTETPAPRRRHACDDGCVCPVHGTPLIYWPAGDDHACQDVTCEHGHGMEELSRRLRQAQERNSR